MKKIAFLLITLMGLSLTACGGGDGGSSGGSNINNSGKKDPDGTNQVPLNITGGFNGKAENRSFISIKICSPGSVSDCQTIDNIMVDSGSTGLRINKSALSVTNLEAIKYNTGQLFSCMYFGAGYDFGPVYRADLYIGGEKATNLPTQIISDDNSDSEGLEGCASGGPFADLKAFGANGIIGVNVNDHPNDGYTTNSTCDANGNNCFPIQVSDININPVALFPVDNNGLIFSLPNVEKPTTTPVSGTLTFGLNTQSNNQVDNNAIKIAGSNAYDNLWGGFIVGGTQSMFDSGAPTIVTPLGGDVSMAISAPVCNNHGLIYFCPDTLSTENIPYTDGNFVDGNIPVSFIDPGFNKLVTTMTIIPYLFVEDNSPRATTIFGFPYFLGHKIYLGLKSATNSPLGSSPAWGFVKN